MIETGEPSKKLTPLMQQYWGIKSRHLDKILLFRMGDFFEMFHEDAIQAAPILNIALTQRNKKSGDGTKMCGVPHHSIAGPIAKLLQAGLKVAICDQIEDPATAKGIVERAVTQVLTPGMVYDPETLDQLASNYIAAVEERQIAFADLTTGEAFYYDHLTEEEKLDLLHLLRPVEVVVSTKHFARKTKLHLNGAVFSEFDLPTIDESLPLSVQRLLSYTASLRPSGEAALHLDFSERVLQKTLKLSPKVLQHLEIFETYQGDKKKSLFGAIDRTKTSSGARLLKQWLAFPLVDPVAIGERRNAVTRWLSDPGRLKQVREWLSKLGDIERRLGKLSTSTCGARDLLSLADSLEISLSMARLAWGLRPELLNIANDLAQTIARTLVEEPPVGTKDGGLIQRGFSPELDELFELTDNAQKLLLELEQRERDATGVSSLKVRYNNVFGFYIEMTKAHAHKAPEHYRRKQTLTNAERFTTDELAKLEEKILSARTRRNQLEFEIYADLKAQVLKFQVEILELARALAAIDVLSALAWLAMERGYHEPKVAAENEIYLKNSRHPVVEMRAGGTPFVPNTVHLKNGEVLLLTGPNMAGKSTLMRQVALNCLLAQIGSYVPAEEARLPILTAVFSRIGASDSLSEGLSTFMVEMTETAEILSRASSSTLVIMDEIGRGTSTYDGMSLAQAILEYLIAHRKPYLLFATHYHELTSLENVWPQIQNAHMSVQEKAGDIDFLHKLSKGPANRSYGIQVARLAGLPREVTVRAKSLLEVLERGPVGSATQLSLGALTVSVPEDAPIEEPVVPSATAAWIEELRALSVSQMTPLEALNKIAEWQRSLS